MLVAAGGAAGLAMLGSDLDELVAGEAAAAAPGERPNVLVVVIDSLRTDHVGAYGGRRARTPNLDAFARESLRFTRAYPESMPTVPARRAMWTGRRSFPFRNWRPVRGLGGNPGVMPIPRGHVTLPTLLRRAGYTTGYVTDNPHLLLPPFDSFRRSFHVRPTITGQLPLRRHVGNKIGDRELMRWWPRELRGEPGAGRLREYLTVNRIGRKEDDYLTARVFRSGIDFLERVGTARQPFALVVDSFDPHEPWDPPHRYLRQYANVRRGPQPIQPFRTPVGETRDLRASTMRRARALYAAEVSFVDAWFGNLLGSLEALGLAGNTWVMVLSDHGVLLGEHGVVGKSPRNLYHELLDIPFMIRHPARAQAGARSAYRASTHDVTPTVLGAAGLGVPRAMDGQDLTALFEGRRAQRRDYFTSAMSDWVVAGDDRWLMFCHNQGGKAHLFDTRSDPGEHRNLARRKRRQARRLYGKVRADAGGRPPRFRAADVDR